MELRSRRKLSSDPVVNVRYKSSSSSDDDDGDKDDSLLASDDTLESDGEFESDDDSDERTIEPGSPGEAVEKRLPGLPLAETSNVGLPVEDEIVEIPNVPPAPPAKKRRRNQPKLIWKTLKEVDEKWISENRANTTNLENFCGSINETAEPSLDMTMPLLRYQKEWLAWALKQEASENKGGILADEMGMGKIIEAIALVLTTRAKSQATSKFTKAPVLGQEVKGTLVICPAVALTQWESEIKCSTEKGSVKVLLYHGAKREKRLHELQEYDFVLTTPALVEKEYAWKCCTCGPPSEQYVSKIIRKPSSISLNIASNTKHITGIRKGASTASQSEIASNLHSVKWQRIILDEAQFIKDKNGETAMAVFALDASFRWVLSGIPIQTSFDDLYSLFRFLRVYPYSYHFCRSCDCKLHDKCKCWKLSPSASCKSCSHSPKAHFSWWKKYFANPIRRFQYRGLLEYSERSDDAMILLKNKILKGIMLRRTKKSQASEIALPLRMVSLRRDSMDVKEQEYYASINKEYIQHGRSRYSIEWKPWFVIRLRQAVNHPYLVIYSKTAVVGKNMIGCFICSEIAEELVVSEDCAHVFCKTCFTGYECPTCSMPLTAGVTSVKSRSDKISIRGYRADSILQRINLEDFHTSTKIDALKEEITFMLERDGSAKGVVFSEFNQFLDLISYSLEKCSISSVSLVGPISLSARSGAIKKFWEDPDCRILLASLQSGGYALNLEVASHVFLMEPAWKLVLEQQAIARVHRKGQHKPTRVVRFVTKNSIEKSVLKNQEWQVKCFEGIFGESSYCFEDIQLKI